MGGHREPAVALQDCTFSYPDGRPVVSGLNWHLPPGVFAVLSGPTGSGKTTILRLLLRLQRPTSGRVYVLGEDLERLSARQRPRLRRRIGVVSQELSLLNDRTVQQNLKLALAVRGVRGRAAGRRVAQLLQEGRLMHRRHDHPVQLSSGERQRLAVARAAAGIPDLILADEPTAHLDSDHAARIVDWLHRLRTAGSTVIVATHSRADFDRGGGTMQFELGHGSLREL
jgi:cell division transport system ATP-binding protein